MTKADLIEKLHKGAGKGLSKRALEELVDELFGHVVKSVKKDKRFSYPGFGTFTLKKRAARVGRNLKTQDLIQIPASKTVSFRPAPNVKASL